VNPLDNPIWEALETKLARFAEVGAAARRFPPEITLLAGCAEPTTEAFASLATLQTDGRPSVLFLDRVVNPPVGWKVIERDSLVQMVAAREAERPEISEDIIELGEADTAEMLALAKLTKPGPFGTRTRELGTFLGLRREGRLAAMAGERLRLANYAEVSAVCTHPDFLGHGLAAGLMAAVMERTKKKGETPILHVRANNSRAIGLYERLGFVERRRFELLVGVPVAR
jgi:predicted GNAT family acetyltransferase